MNVERSTFNVQRSMTTVTPVESTGVWKLARSADLTMPFLYVIEYYYVASMEQFSI